MDCEVCGGLIYGRGKNIIIDGARLKVCSKCVLSTNYASQTYKQQPLGKKKTAVPKFSPRRAIRKGKDTMHEDLTLVEHYNSLVRKSRENIGLTHDELSRKIGEKASLLQKLETGKMVPDQTLIKKLERALKIKLVQPLPRIAVEKKFIKKPFELTLGAVVSLQKKKSSGSEEESKREL